MPFNFSPINRFKSIFGKKDPDEPINLVGRILNVLSQNWRGIIGTIPLLFLPVFLTELKTRRDKTVKAIWLAMFWLLLVQPVNVPVTGMVPVFAFPCLHVLSSDAVCSLFFNPTMVLFIVGGWLLMLLNNCEFDKRVILWLLSRGNGQLSSYSLLIRSSFAAFILSMFSNRLMVTEATMNLVCGPLTKQSTEFDGGTKKDYETVKNILCNAIATSSSIGSIAIMHASYATLAMRAMWELHGSTPDVFNFFQYSVFALPLAIVMFLLNLGYHVLMLKMLVKIPMSQESLDTMSKEFAKEKENLPPKITLHEILSIIFLILSLTLYFCRWSEIIKKIVAYMGWADYRKLDQLNNPQIADATVSSLFVIILHIIPKSYNFTKYFKLKLKKKDLPPAKPERGILYWRFVDKNTNYGYILLIGGGLALNVAIASVGLEEDLREVGSFITAHRWCVGIGIVCLLSAVLCNIMTSVAAVIILLPFVLNMAPPGSIWEERLHLTTLAVGIGCSFGFTLPFKYTPSYYVKETGKVSLCHQINYARTSVIICFVVLWAALCSYGNLAFVGDTFIATPNSTTGKYEAQG